MTQDDAPKLYQLAKSVCGKHDDINGAVSALMNRVKRLSKSSRETVIAEALAWACREAVYDARHVATTRLKFSPGHCTTRTASAMAAVNGAAARSLLNMTMPDGRLLGDYVGSELEPVAADADEKARGFAQNAAFFRRMAALAGDRVVRKAVSDSQARDEWEKVTKCAGEAKPALNTIADVPTRKTTKRAPVVAHV